MLVVCSNNAHEVHWSVKNDETRRGRRKPMTMAQLPFTGVTSVPVISIVTPKFLRRVFQSLAKIQKMDPSFPAHPTFHLPILAPKLY